MTGWLSLAISLIAIAVAVIVMHRMIDRRAGSAAVMDAIRREVGAILTEMNQTTERNIELIEDRVRKLQETIELADKRLGVLRGEAKRQEGAERVYSHLSRVSRLVPNPADESPAAGPAPPALPADSPSIPDAVPAGAPVTEIEREPTMNERVLGLYRQGISVERIASRVGTAVSEIELIVSLGERA